MWEVEEDGSPGLRRNFRLHPFSMNSGFLDKLIERINRVRPEEVQGYLLRLADEQGFPRGEAEGFVMPVGRGSCASWCGRMTADWRAVRELRPPNGNSSRGTAFFLPVGRAVC